VKPAFSDLLVDVEGNLWVEEYRVPSVKHRPVHWSVFDAEGRWLGNVRTPPGLQLRYVGTDRVIGFWQDEDDVKHVRVHALAKRQ